MLRQIELMQKIEKRKEPKIEPLKVEDLYRENYKSNIVKCGKTEHNVNGIVLKFRKIFIK